VSVFHSYNLYKVFVLPKGLLLLFFFLFGTIVVEAQILSEENEADSSRIDLIFSRKMKGIQLTDGDYLYLEGDVHFLQGNMHMWCDTAKRYPNKQIIAYGDVQMVQNDSIRVFSDSLFYDGNSRKSRLSGDVVLQDSTMTMFTSLLFYDLNTKIADYPKGALVVSDSTQLISKSGYYDANTNIAYFVDSVRMTNPNYKLIADSLAFDTQKEIAYFSGPTYIYNNEDLVYCEGGYYDNNKNYAELTGNPYYLQRNDAGYKKAKGDTIIYDGSIKKYYLIGNAVYEDGDKEVRADTIVRDGETDQFQFIGNPKFRSLDSTKNQTIDSKYSFYDSKTETVIFREDVRIVDNRQVLIADSLDYTKSNNIGIARGRVVWEDSSSNVRILCGEAIYNDSTGHFLAKDHPILVSKMDNDSLWLTADTLRAVPDSLDKEKKTFFAYNNVKIFKKDLQGLCDSLTYSQSDSIFQFFSNPILWLDSVQFTADTIRAIMANGKMSKAYMYQNSVIISTEDEIYFNQIKGRNMLADFIDNKLNTLDVRSNGKAIYYAYDNEKRYMGVNDVNCSDMFLFFAENSIQRIKFTGEPQAVLYPMGMTDHSTLRIKEFRWLEKQRPKSKFEVTADRDWSFRLKELSPKTAFSEIPALFPENDSTEMDTALPENRTDSITNLPLKGDKMGKMGKKEDENLEKTEEKPKPTTSKKSKLDPKKED
jgi:lipopolysaccharide export system protein LptA